MPLNRFDPKLIQSEIKSVIRIIRQYSISGVDENPSPATRVEQRWRMGGFVFRASKHKDDPPLPYLHEELIRGEILLRLLVKSLVRFQYVCKSWKLLLSSDPVFVQSHLTRNCMDPNKCSLITRCLPRNIHKYKFHHLKSRYLELGGSINGLVCVYHFDNHSITCLGIWNPNTNQYKDIPLPPSTAATNIIRGSSDFSFGLVFDSVANDYKLVFVAIY
ncbi:putative F-box protein At3g16210 [Apium graveolens]|uniref:putative F-box protein At3g16210 n=1 Tax=Apium graveolens TaxID=4045 RepID=UPI003D7AF410